MDSYQGLVRRQLYIEVFVSLKLGFPLQIFGHIEGFHFLVLRVNAKAMRPVVLIAVIPSLYFNFQWFEVTEIHLVRFFILRHNGGGRVLFAIAHCDVEIAHSVLICCLGRERLD